MDDAVHVEIEVVDAGCGGGEDLCVYQGVALADEAVKLGDT